MQGNAGGFQQMTQDALTVMNDIPFSIPPYFALLGRAIVTLEGIALTGDPSYGKLHSFKLLFLQLINFHYLIRYCHGCISICCAKIIKF